MNFIKAAGKCTGRISDNYFYGPPTENHIEITATDFHISGLFMMSLEHERMPEVNALLSSPRKWWRRMLVAVARWLLRRAR